MLAWSQPAPGAERFDVVVYGGTPGGIAAALTAARAGRAVALVEYHKHLGGMSASGLGKSDIDTREAIGGVFNEFVERVYRHYVNTYGQGHENVKVSQNGYTYEPSVAERIFEEMVVAESRIKVYRNHRLTEVVRSGSKVTAIGISNRQTASDVELRGSVFIDGTYEGDLAAFAGASYRVGREARAEFNELHAGVVFLDHTADTFLAGTTGAGDRAIQAYTYRPCLTDDPANGVPITAPPGYERKLYLPYLEDIKAGRLTPRGEESAMARAVTFALLPNRKFDINMRPVALAYPFVELNFDYPEADWDKREQIAAHIRNVTLGLFYFMQNDPALPEEQRAYVRRFYLAKDEFRDNGNFPWQLYVREGRRVLGEYTLRESDLTLAPGLDRTPIFFDSISAGEYPIDAMPAHKRADDRKIILEGYINRLVQFTRPYQIPMRIMVPKDVDALLVPVAVSATHVGFSSIRLEPTWMALGQAAGIAAHLAIQRGERIRDLRAERIQRVLLGQDQVLTFFRDIDKKHPAYRAMQFLGAKGFFRDYYARPADPVTRGLAANWLNLVLRTTGWDIAVRSGGTGWWLDLPAGSQYSEEILAMSLAGIIPRPAGSSRFEAALPLSRSEFKSWLCRAGQLLGVWRNPAECAAPEAVLDANGMAESGWAETSEASSSPIRRGEFCRAAFALLERAGY